MMLFSRFILPLLFTFSFCFFFDVSLAQTPGVYQILYGQTPTQSDYLQLRRKANNSCTQTDLSARLHPYYQTPIMTYEPNSDIIYTLALYHNSGNYEGPFVPAIVGWDLSGNMVLNNLIPDVGSMYIGLVTAGMVADPETGHLIITAPSSSDKQHYHLFDYDPVANITNDLGVIFDGEKFFEAEIIIPLTIDPSTRILYADFDRIYIFNMSSGESLGNFKDVLFMNTLDFNPSDGLLYGIGYRALCSTTLSLATYNVSFVNGVLNVRDSFINCISGPYNCMEDGVSALIADVPAEGNSFLWVQLCNRQPISGTWSSVRISLQNGAVTDTCGLNTEGFVSANYV